MPGYVGVIVESPSKCAKIESFLGHGYKCMATYGHFRELSSLDNVAFDNGYIPTYTDTKSKRDKISALSKFIKKASKVLLAADDDREGEGIAWHVCDRFGLNVNTTDRILFHEVTKSAVVEAVNSPMRLNMNVVRAQQARQVLDLLVGFTVSPLLWKAVQCPRTTTLSAGRCQSPALRLIFDNQSEIDSSEAEASYSAVGSFTSKNIDVPLCIPIADNATALKFVKDSATFDHVHSLSKEQLSKKKAPLPFTTSLIQQKASSEYRVSPAETMSACQGLYERGLITYHRTDMQVYAKEFLDAAAAYVKKEYGLEYARKNVGSDKISEGAQAAHEAIRPTNINNKTPPGLDGKLAKIYKLIHRNTLESCMTDAEYLSLKWTISAPPIATTTQAFYRKCLEKATFPGWQRVSGRTSSDTMYDYIQALPAGVIGVKTVECSYTVKRLKQHLTEAKLVQALEKAGIGRPSTFSSLVEKIQTRAYVKKGNVPGRSVECPIIKLEDNRIVMDKKLKKFGEEKGKLIIQDIGKNVMNFLVSNFDDLFKYSFTKEMEDSLDKVANGLLTHNEVCSKCHALIKTAISANGLDKSLSLRIDEQHTYIVGKYGPCIKKIYDGKTSFLSIKKDITRAKIVENNLGIDDICAAEKKGTAGTARVVGEYLGEPVEIKAGRFGPYLAWKGRNYKWPGNGRDKPTANDTPSAEEMKAVLGADVQLADNIWLKRNSRGFYVLKRNPAPNKPTFLNLPADVNPRDIKQVKKWLRSI
tara:strand:+ start:796 stop:3066 length:2271 start_codon:yes stop_codon:yes gene_type:complete